MMGHWDCSLSLKVDLADVLTFYPILFSEVFPIESGKNTLNLSLLSSSSRCNQTLTIGFFIFNIF